jgi:AmmeMemoRadiSam system protein B/AmmeMemoRadiSam system protein A
MFGNTFSSHKHRSEDRPPVVAGQFYPGDKNELRQNLARFFQNATEPVSENLHAIVSPHAGYTYSGQVAADAINQITPDRSFDRIFLLGSSHYVSFGGASIYTAGNYQTPLGKVEVDTAFARSLIKKHTCFLFNPQAHDREHSLEVQLPFLQFHLKKPFRIVPVIIGSQSPETIGQVAEALKPYFNENNLFIVSSDFSHYPDYDSANKIDAATADAISANSPDHFLNTLNKHNHKGISQLATGMCGWPAMLAVLKITANDEQFRIMPLRYQNSGDVQGGSKSRVVGYWAITVCKNKVVRKDILTERDKNTLLATARRTLAQHFENKTRYNLKNSEISKALQTTAGAFVSLYCNGKLRGCIGRLSAQKPLYETVQSMVVSAATSDRRFELLKPEELNDTVIEISVLTPLRKITSIEEIELEKHGIYIKKGYQTGTFLPQVAQNNSWSKEEFLGYCSRDKANIGWDGWRDAEVFIYEAIVFSDKR